MKIAIHIIALMVYGYGYFLFMDWVNIPPDQMEDSGFGIMIVFMFGLFFVVIGVASMIDKACILIEKMNLPCNIVGCYPPTDKGRYICPKCQQKWIHFFAGWRKD